MRIATVDKTMRLAPLMYVVYFSFLTTVASQISTSFGDNPAFCFNSQPSAHILPVSENVSEVVGDSPYYIQVSPILNLANVDSICITNFKVDDNSYLQFNGFRYSDGSYLIEKVILSGLTEFEGLNRIQGLGQDSGSSTFVLDQVYLGSPCPGVKVYYIYYIAARCNILGDLTQNQGDYVNGLSSSRDISDYCKSQVVAVANSQQLRGTQLVGLPNRLNRCCVTQFIGASCVNADRVLPQDSVSVPDSGTSSGSC